MIKAFEKVGRSEEECPQWSRDKEGLETAGRAILKDGELAVVVGFEVALELH